MNAKNLGVVSTGNDGLSLGERLFDVAINGRTSVCGVFLSCHGGSFKCSIDGEVYSVRRDVEVDTPLWSVLRVNNGSRVELKDDLALSCLIPGDFILPQRNLFKVNTIAF